jgi:hypothetical protein
MVIRELPGLTVRWPIGHGLGLTASFEDRSSEFPVR